MRIRQVRQEFWTDEKLAALPDAVRLFYIGLWCIADDTGWFRSDIARIGALIYPYRAKRKREREISAWLAQLVELGCLVVEGAGRGARYVLPRDG